ncbi:hypothetical protein niasHS_017995 [Heterodera schachtii]|uniref:Uncharacterized protein n=1 Tax=Heterodera schachtii TaxID=97005 RepID=A0ABD2HWW1_HETSC
MSLYFNILLVLLILLVHLFRRYSGRLVAAVLQRLLHARAAHIDGLGWFALRHGELLLANGLHLEVRDLRVHSLFNWWWTTTAPTVDGTANDGGGQRMALNVRVSVGSIRVGKQLTDEEGSRNSTNGLCDGQPLIEKCGVLDSVSIHLARPVPGQLHLQVELQQPVELIWSPVLHLMVNDVVRAFVSKVSQLVNFFDSFKHCQQKQFPATTTDGDNNNNGTPTATQTPTSTTTTFLFTVHSEHAVELSFRLPCHHLLRLILPSFTVQRKAACVANAGAPNLLVEMDGNLIMNVERPSLDCVADDLLMKMIRGGDLFAHQLELDVNRLWSWSADSLEISFPYGYQFADAWEELSFRLPRHHLLRLILPSFTVQRKAACVANAGAPNLLVEMDGNLIMNVERPSLDCVADDLLMKMIRGGDLFAHQLELDANRLWSWSADSLEISFPYGYQFADAWEEHQWMKLVHGIVPKPFTKDSVLPADVRIRLNRLSLRLDDDPFEIQLQNIYELSHRREMRDGRVVHVPLRTPRDKLQHALRSIAWPMSQAGLSTVICVLPLVFLQYSRMEQFLSSPFHKHFLLLLEFSPNIKRPMSHFALFWSVPSARDARQSRCARAVANTARQVAARVALNRMANWPGWAQHGDLRVAACLPSSADAGISRPVHPRRWLEVNCYRMAVQRIQQISDQQPNCCGGGVDQNNDWDCVVISGGGCSKILRFRQQRTMGEKIEAKRRGKGVETI